MAVTRRSRLQGSDDEAERAPLLGRQQQQRPPPPPPPPPMMQNNDNISNNNNNNVVDIDTNSNDVNSTNNRIDNSETLHPEAAMANRVNQNNNNIDIQYLQVRVPPPATQSYAMLRPFHIHRRKRSSSPPRAASVPLNERNKRRESDSNTGSRKSTSNRAMSKQQQAYTDGEIVRILIPPNGFASERQLAECLSQAGEMTAEDDRGGANLDEYRDDLSWDSIDEYYEYNQPKLMQAQPANVAGMFRESDRVFIPLSVIYLNPISFVGDVLSLKRPPPPVRRSSVPPPTRAVKPQRSIFIQFLEIFGILAVVVVSWWSYSAACYVDWEDFFDSMITKFELSVWSIVSLPFWLFDVLVEFPLRELYRYGPSVVGWEGEPLPRICAQITYTGDEGFWSRNIEECERIYRAKEDAAMLFRKPLLVSVIVVVIFYMVKSIVEARALRRRERIDPNMVETFRAINMLSRQLRRAMNTR